MKFGTKKGLLEQCAPNTLPYKRKELQENFCFKRWERSNKTMKQPKLERKNEGPAIVQVAVQYFRQIGDHDAAYVLKEIQTDHQEVWEKVRKYFVLKLQNTYSKSIC